ncbi:MAG TPA: alpha/beta fold hydrolase [Solirubrobacterales bacterium]|jgi:pimeloyl-ACP methyl ester carboxylesterase
MSSENLEPQPFEVDGRLRGETMGEGPPVVLCHGITATRRQVVHGSNVLAREGYRMVQYDARGHGESEPAPDGTGYGSPQNVADLRLVIEEQVGDRQFVLGGHSMGSHTAVAYALESPEQIAGLVVIGPAYAGPIADPEERQRGLGRWDALADGLEQGGVEGFLEVMDRQGLDPGWRETILGFTRERMETHRYPDAVAQAMREVPRSKPFESMDELEFLALPALVVASHDVADPGHPYAMAEAYAARLPRARMISEAEGESPLAWQGGRLSREIAAFSSEPAVANILGA